ncbi:Major facilitator superfamily domain general substrate transporter [Penicillium bovifimosum]|uniref:Major facilitator superfamily domain general substrate transporter n=1 Tax=Penicillium bovifimosum TaxID=126998 RepID=A0A9W9GW88_9EURO|nr:Major facilitator superfamily domain general substrate transporter [Penicillium bovifimosum]KAJ5131083.1 Major facilitator superfamily domain general substrate transporter [Penicillium bovifimosum]
MAPSSEEQRHKEQPSENMTSTEKQFEDREGPSNLPTGTRLLAIIVSILLAMFLVALDRTIIATAVPKISTQFNALDDISWYASAYLLTSCATQLSWGKIYTFYRTKTVFLIAILIFEAGSALCGAAPNSNAFIVGRAIAGAGSAGIFSGATVIITQIVPLAKRPIYIGMMGSIFGISSIIGPLMGGAFTDNVTWRWCFYINLPIGGFTMVVLFLFLTVPHTAKPCTWKQHFLRLDPLGSVLFLPSVICFLLALQWGGNEYPWNNGRMIALFVVSGILMIAFVAVQIWLKKDATVPPHVFAQRSIISGVIFSMLVGGGLISMLYTLPLWFQGVRGTTAVKSGIDTIPMVIALVVGSILAGGIITATGYYTPWMFVAAILMSTGAGLMTTFKRDTYHAAWIGYQVLFGIGIGTGMQQPSMAAQTVLRKDEVPIGVSLMFFAQSFGGAVFISVAQSLFQNYLRANLPHVQGIDVGKVLAAGATGLSTAVPTIKLPEVLVLYNDGLRRSFIVTVAVSCLMVLPALTMEWRTVKRNKSSESA